MCHCFKVNVKVTCRAAADVILMQRAVPALRAETARRVWIQWTIVKSNFYTLCISQESQRKKNKMGNGYNNMFNMFNRVVLITNYIVYT